MTVGMVPRMTRLTHWEGDLPDVGEYLETKTGKRYVVLKVVPNTRPGAKSVARLDMLALDRDDPVDPTRARHGFQWNPRGKRRG